MPGGFLNPTEFYMQGLYSLMSGPLESVHNIFCVNEENKLQLIVDNLGARNMACSSIQCFYLLLPLFYEANEWRSNPVILQNIRLLVTLVNHSGSAEGSKRQESCTGWL